MNRDLNLSLVVAGGLVLALGFFSAWLKNRSWLSMPLVALLVGLLLGPSALGVLDPARWGSLETLLGEAARLTLAIGLMAVALRLPQGYVLRHARPLAVLLGLVMPLMALTSGLLAYLLLGLPPLGALLLGAVVTPTDPVVASSIVTGKAAKDTLPDQDRHLLSAESGLNDGLAYPLVLLPVLLLDASSTAPLGATLGEWLSGVVLREVLGGALTGLALGLATGRLLRWCERRGLIEQPSFLATSLALALLVLGGAKLLGMNGVLAVFLAGLAFGNVVGGGQRAREDKVQEVVNQFFSIPIFVLLGLLAPVGEWRALGWAGPALALAVLALRRLPFVLLLRRGLRPLRRTPDLLFLGWFGPIGVSGLFYAALALRRTGMTEIWTAASLIICASVLVHGLSGTPFVKWYARRAPPPSRSRPDADGSASGAGESG